MNEVPSLPPPSLPPSISVSVNLSPCVNNFLSQFPKTMLSLEDLQELGLPSNETHLESVKRYSDFTRLHQQLQKSPELQRHTQGQSSVDPCLARAGPNVHFMVTILDPRQGGITYQMYKRCLFTCTYLHVCMYNVQELLVHMLVHMYNYTYLHVCMCNVHVLLIVLYHVVCVCHAHKMVMLSSN